MADRRLARTRLAILVAARAAARLSPMRLLRLGASFAVPDALLAAPPCLVAGDAAVAAALYGGTFDLAGAHLDAGGRAVFDLPPPSDAFAQELHGFAWLADLAAASTALTRAHARALIEQWIHAGRSNTAAQDLAVTARRLLNWLTHGPFLVEDAEPAFRRRFLRALAREAGRLRRDARRAPLGLPRLTAAVALTQAGLCLADGGRYMSAGRDRLAADLRLLVLPDGGIATRNPQDLVDIALNLLPLRAVFAERGLEPPRELLLALDRILPMLRFFRHGDGSLALFNGMGATRHDLLEAIIALDDTLGEPVRDARFSGYQRLVGGRTLVLADTGRPPPLALSGNAHAGTLSFELSSGPMRIVVNCGAPGDGHPGRRMAARKTAAHSTVSVGNASSSRFLSGKLLNSMLGPLIREGPRHVPVVREDHTGTTTVRVSHDGYASRFGFVHERTLKLDAMGVRLEGTDVLRPVRRKTGAEIEIAMHLHPDVRATVLEEGRAVLLTLADGEAWLFAAEDHAASVEESIFFAAPGGARRAEQIVIRLGRKSGARVSWSFERTGQPPAPPAAALS